MKKLLFVLLILCVALSAQNVKDLNRILKATNAGWTAADNSLTRMPMQQQQALLGLLPGIADMQALPDEDMSYDMVRATRYEAPHTAIRNQRSCGSCYSFGASASYESHMLLKGKRTDVSEQDFMMKAKAIGPSGGCNGWWLDTSMNLLKNKGVTNESKCPYLGREKVCSHSGSENKIAAWSRTTSLAAIKSALKKYGAVYCGFAVYSDFMSYHSGVYKYTSGSLRGYHAVCIVGYDDAKQCFKVKNSWGTGWGERGYFRIAYSEMHGKSKFGTCFGGSYYITR